MFILLLSVAAYLTIFFCIGLGLFVFLKKKSGKSFTYLLLNLNLSVWAVCMLMIIKSWQNIPGVVSWIRIANAVSVFMPAILYNFIGTIGQEVRIKKKEMTAYYVLSFFFALMALFNSGF